MAEETKDLSTKLTKLMSEIETLTVLELSDLVKALEDKFGVSATAVAAAPVAGASATADSTPAEEKSSFDVIISEAGASKINVIKIVRELVPALGLKDAKDLVEAAPKAVLENVKKEVADEAKQKLEAAGAKVEVK